MPIPDMPIMDDAAGLEDLATLLRDVFQDDRLAVTRATMRDDVAQWDSMNHLNIVMALEMRHGIKFSLADIEAIHGVEDLLRLIRRKTGLA